MMNRQSFHQMFGSKGPVVTPVIHVVSTEQVMMNLDILRAAGCPGAFLINHDFGREAFLPILREVRRAMPDLWLGVNFLAEDGRIGFATLGQLSTEGLHFQALWADDACLDERQTEQPSAQAIAAARETSIWKGMYFGGVAFKKQRPVADADLERAAQLGAAWLDVVTTSGLATGQAPDLAKIARFRAAIGDAPLALASGITPENAALFAAHVDCFLVATGINQAGDFYNIDPARLAALLHVVGSQEVTHV
jgi:predicted TIM-barrel enzyme